MEYEQIIEAADFIRTKIPIQPEQGIILGTGLGNLSDEVTDKVIIPYGEIPHFPTSTVQSHKGQLVVGYLDGTPVVTMAGRLHYYEGYSMQEVVFPVRVLHFLGIKRLFISNVAGSVNPEYEVGDIIVIKDHINLQPDSPLRGSNDERLGPRFPDLLTTYDKNLCALAMDFANQNGISAHLGVYAALQGPNLETPAEYVYLNRIGADVVGMSTVPEVIAAKHMGLKVFVVSVVSNKCFPVEMIRETSVEDVIKVGNEVEPKLTMLIKDLLGK